MDAEQLRDVRDTMEATLTRERNGDVAKLRETLLGRVEFQPVDHGRALERIERMLQELIDATTAERKARTAERAAVEKEMRALREEIRALRD
jgi:hypothetical protein